jgi:uncharacterized membrane protein
MQSTAPLGGNPFAVLTAVVAPAILTNACSILALGTSNRLARVVDRTRIVATELGALEIGSAYYKATERQLDGLQVRAQLLVKALRVIYASLGLFAAAALVSVGGSISSYYGQALMFELAAILAILTGASATTGLCIGCFLMVRETRVAMQNLAEEATIRSTRSVGSQSRRGQ